jgi:hypothetical protein
VVDAVVIDRWLEQVRVVLQPAKSVSMQSMPQYGMMGNLPFGYVEGHCHGHQVGNVDAIPEFAIDVCYSQISSMSEVKKPRVGHKFCDGEDL